MGDSKIEWTEKTWNPVTGCSKVSQGCKNCYAEGVANRFWGDRAFTDVRTHEDRVDAPLHWRKPARIFVNSMSDLFHEKVPFEFIDRVFAVMALCPQHTFQILTKRPERMLEYCQKLTDVAAKWARKIEKPFTPSDVLNLRHVAAHTIDGHTYGSTFPYHPWPLPNVWLGVSVEDQKTADERIPLLLQTPAAVRWISYEPALGPINLLKWLRGYNTHDGFGKGVSCIRCGGSFFDRQEGSNLATSQVGRRESWYEKDSANLETRDGSRESREVNFGRVSNGDVFGRKEAPQSLCPSCRLDDLEPAGYSRENADQSQRRSSREHASEKPRVGNSLGECASRNLHSYPKTQGAIGAEQPPSHIERLGGGEDQGTGWNDTSAPNREDVCSETTDSIEHNQSPHLAAPPLNWIVCGGESGPKARPMHPEWARSVRDQCQVAGVPYFFKQWGAWEPISTTTGMHESPFGYNVESMLGFTKVGKKIAGRSLDGHTWDEYPKVSVSEAR